MYIVCRLQCKLYILFMCNVQVLYNIVYINLSSLHLYIILLSEKSVMCSFNVIPTQVNTQDTR